jgi:tRNA pseudouridine55 synthase
VGPATKLVDYLMTYTKDYEATITFGTATDTDDADGEVVEQLPVPAAVASEEYARAYLQTLVGEHEQLPPVYSAIKHNGVPAYRAAREGKPVERKPRPITIYEAKLLCSTSVSWRVHFKVSKGTYIRALARDIGKALGTCAHISALCRTACGDLTLEQASTLAELEAAPSIEPFFLNPIEVLGLPTYEVPDADLKAALNGNAIPMPTCKHIGDRHPALDAGPIPTDAANVTDVSVQSCSTLLIALTYEHTLLSIYRYDPQAQSLIPQTVIPGGVHGA